MVTEEDFIGSTCEINYVIRQEKLGKGNQYGEIIVKTPYQKLVYHVLASRGTESAVKPGSCWKTVPDISDEGIPGISL